MCGTMGAMGRSLGKGPSPGKLQRARKSQKLMTEQSSPRGSELSVPGGSQVWTASWLDGYKQNVSTNGEAGWEDSRLFNLPDPVIAQRTFRWC